MSCAGGAQAATAGSPVTPLPDATNAGQHTRFCPFFSNRPTSRTLRTVGDAHY